MTALTSQLPPPLFSFHHLSFSIWSLPFSWWCQLHAGKAQCCEVLCLKCSLVKCRLVKSSVVKSNVVKLSGVNTCSLRMADDMGTLYWEPGVKAIP